MNAALKPRASQRRGIRQDQGSILVDRVEQFALLKRATPEELSNLKEFFYVLVNKADREQRRRMSIALARNPYSPRSILIFLALDEVDVASPVLLFSQALTSKDLCNIISKTTIKHRQVIARRDNIETDAIQALLDYDDAEGSILEILQRNLTITDNLATVQGQRASGNSASFPHMVKQSISQPAETATAAPNHGTKDLSDKLLKLAKTGGKLGSGASRIEKSTVDAGARDELGQNLIVAARERRQEVFCNLIRSACGLSPDHTRGFIEQDNVGTFACLLKAIDMTRVTAARIMLLMFPKLGRDEAVLADVMLRYDGLDKTSLLAYFKTVDQNFEFQTQHEKLVSQADMFSKLLENRRNSILETPEPTPEDALRNIKISA